jgi:hypothetical protein
MNRQLLLVAGVGFFVACGGSSIRSGGDDGGDGDGQGGRGGNEPIPGGKGGTFGKGGTAGVSVPSGGTIAGGGPSTGGFGATGVGGVGGSVGGRGGGAASDGGLLEPPGPVLCGGTECPSPRACCQTSGVCFDPATEGDSCPQPDPDPDPDNGDRVPCASSAHCGPDEYCRVASPWLCQGEGFCEERTNCPSSSYAVCGCDGNSYPNLQTACRSGASASSIFYGGGCGDTIDANSGEPPPRWVTLCGSDAHCASGERCCNITGICYPTSDPGRCQVPPEGTQYPCTADDQCYPGYEFCFGFGCSGPGGCANIENQECGVRLEPVCGCNGVSYTSAPCAAVEGVRVASEGQCGAE